MTQPQTEELIAHPLAESRVAIFAVRMPRGLTAKEQALFKQEVRDSLVYIVRDAEMALDSEWVAGA